MKKKKQMNPVAKSLSEKQNRPQKIPNKKRESYDRYMYRQWREYCEEVEERKAKRCVKQCKLGEDGRCIGCCRTLEEIAEAGRKKDVDD